jgi:hypothetical protein
MNENRPQLYADLRVKTGSYEVDGKTKNRYAEIGVLFASPHFSNMYMQIDTLPISKDWDGRIYVNPRSEKVEDTPTHNRPLTQHEVLNEAHKDSLPTDEDLSKPLDFEIPF